MPDGLYSRLLEKLRGETAGHSTLLTLLYASGWSQVQKSFPAETNPDNSPDTAKQDTMSPWSGHVQATIDALTPFATLMDGFADIA